jgi:hypothetical protein
MAFITGRGRALPSPMGQSSPVHNQSSTSSIREEDSIDISEQASTKSSPAWVGGQDAVNAEEMLL